jgi:hypothetical protein
MWGMTLVASGLLAGAKRRVLEVSDTLEAEKRLAEGGGMRRLVGWSYSWNLQIDEILSTIILTLQNTSFLSLF